MKSHPRLYFFSQHEHFPKLFDCVEKEPGVSVLAAQFVKPCENVLLSAIATVME
ncbi:hypothetical protein NXX77_00055 [Phocaeicola dorei]|nr:hypothetical protein [Phocaeicola dorei]